MTHEVRISQVPTESLLKRDDVTVEVSQVPSVVLCQLDEVTVQMSQVPVIVLLKGVTLYPPTAFDVRYVSVN